MRKKGKLKSWNDEKGFGFIVPPEGGKDVFLHISAFRNRSRRPEVGQYVSYGLATGKDGRPRATSATLPGDRLPVKAPRKGGSASIILAVTFLVIVGMLVAASKLPNLVLGVYLAVSLITFMMYAMDKSAARRGAWRTPEATLHWLSIAGGWPGALIAQQRLRHKSKKERFRMVFWMTVSINCIGFGWLFTSDGTAILQAIDGYFAAAMQWA